VICPAFEVLYKNKNKAHALLIRRCPAVPILCFILIKIPIERSSENLLRFFFVALEVSLAA